MSVRQYEAMQKIYDFYFPQLCVKVPEYPDSEFLTLYIVPGLSCDAIFDKWPTAWGMTKEKWTDGSIDDELDKTFESTPELSYFCKIRLVRIYGGQQMLVRDNYNEICECNTAWATLLESILSGVMCGVLAKEFIEKDYPTLRCEGSCYINGRTPEFCMVSGALWVSEGFSKDEEYTQGRSCCDPFDSEALDYTGVCMRNSY